MLARHKLHSSSVLVRMRALLKAGLETSEPAWLAAAMQDPPLFRPRPSRRSRMQSKALAAQASQLGKMRAAWHGVVDAECAGYKPGDAAAEARLDDLVRQQQALMREQALSAAQAQAVLEQKVKEGHAAAAAARLAEFKRARRAEGLDHDDAHLERWYAALQAHQTTERPLIDLALELQAQAGKPPSSARAARFRALNEPLGDAVRGALAARLTGALQRREALTPVERATLLNFVRSVQSSSGAAPGGPAGGGTRS